MDKRQSVRDAYDEMAGHSVTEYTESDKPLPEPVDQFCAGLADDDRRLAAGFDIDGVWEVYDSTTEDDQKPFFLATLAESGDEG